MKKSIAVAKSQLLLEQSRSKNKAKNFIACKMCIVSGIPYLSGCREYIHRRDSLYHHMKTIHKIIDPGKASQYEYEFEIGVQTTLQFVKKLQLGDSEPELAATDVASCEYVQSRNFFCSFQFYFKSFYFLALYINNWA